MPLPKEVLLKYRNDVFIETGTLHAEATRLAIECGFSVVHSMDIDANLIAGHKTAQAASGKFNVHFYAGSSADLLPAILKNVSGRITFWLDAHPPGNVLDLQNTPVVGELEAIRDYARNLPREQLPTVMLDDMRLFTDQAKLVIAETLRAAWAGELSFEDTHIASKDIMVYRPSM